MVKSGVPTKSDDKSDFCGIQSYLLL